MRKINETVIDSSKAMYFKKGTWTHLQKAYTEGFAETIKSMIGASYSATTVYVLNGCVNTGSGSSYVISAGSVFYGGEIYLVSAATFTVTTGVPVATIVTTANTTDYAADPCLFSDGSTHNVHDIRTVQIAEAASGSGIKNYADFNFYPFAKNYTDISSSVSVSGSVTSVNKNIKKWADGTVEVHFDFTYSGTLSSATTILTGLPIPTAVVVPVTIYLTGGSSHTFGNVALNFSGQLVNPDALSNTYNTGFIYFTYKLD